MGGSVRIASLVDLDRLVILAKEFHEMSPFKEYKFSPSGSRTQFITMIQSPNTVIIMHDDGMIGGSVSDYPFCEMRIAKEAFWYARRSGLGGLVLLEEYMGWVTRHHADIDLMSSLIMPGKKKDVIARLLSRMGYDAIETTHIRKT